MFSFCLFRLYLLNIFKHTGVWMCTPVWGLLIFLDRLSIHSVSVCYLPQNSWLHSPWDQGNEFFPFIWAALTLNAEDCCWFLISKLEGRYNLSWKIFFFLHAFYLVCFTNNLSGFCAHLTLFADTLYGFHCFHAGTFTY